MAGQDLALIQAMYQKMDWHEARQKMLAENISNADTANYAAQDLKPLNFKDLLGNSTSSLSLEAASGGSISSPGMTTTNSKHLNLGGTSSSHTTLKHETVRTPYETSPSKNSVILEEQLMKMNENMMDHRFITNLYQKNIEMLKSSLRSQ